MYMLIVVHVVIYLPQIHIFNLKVFLPGALATTKILTHVSAKQVNSYFSLNFNTISHNICADFFFCVIVLCLTICAANIQIEYFINVVKLIQKRKIVSLQSPKITAVSTVFYKP